jgi:FKBP-type peptidyl-prolyl cis-trans isomerase
MRHGWIKGMAALTFGLLVAQAGFTAGVAPARASEAVGSGETVVLTTPKDRASYSIGVETGRYLKQRGIEVDQELLVKGVKDALTGNKLLLTNEELQEILMLVTAEAKAKINKARLRSAEDNKREAEAFLAANKATEGVVTLSSGLQYMILKAGDGRTPTDTDTVECRYQGTLLDGTEFYNTHHTGRAVTFNLSDTKSVIPGLREALKLMPAGSKWRLFIPPELAYGAQGAGSAIGPNATLIFEVELLAIK